MIYENTLVLGSGSNTFLFNTKDSTGAPITLAGTPSLACRVNGSATQATAGLTLTVDFDSITGQHQVAVDVDNGTLALADGDIVEIYIAAGTVDSISVVGTVLARLSITDGSLLSGTSTDIQAAAAAALNDTVAELSATPAANAAIATMIKWLYMQARNKVDQSASVQQLYADDGSTVVSEAAVSEVSEVVTRAEFADPV